MRNFSLLYNVCLIFKFLVVLKMIEFIISQKTAQKRKTFEVSFKILVIEIAITEKGPSKLYVEYQQNYLFTFKICMTHCRQMH